MESRLSPDTLQAARLARGLSLAGLASACQISAPTLSRIESGARQASRNEAHQLAGALGIPVAALFRPIMSDRLGLSAFYHRKLSRAGARAVSAVENQCVLDVVALRELIGMMDLEFPYSVPTIHSDDIKDGDIEQAANMLRLAWRLPRGPIRDLISVVEQAGCLVIHTDFGVPEIDALYHKVMGMPPVFWTNSRKPLDRVRWSLSHELGHLVLHEDEPADQKRAEDQANTFASAFLMPRSEFRSECPSRLGIPELVEMKRRWRCSMQSIVMRAQSVGKITDRQYRNLMINISQRGWKTREPYPIEGESPRLLAAMVDLCQRQLQLTDDELAERLAVTREKVVAWRQPFTGQRPSVADDTPRLRLVSD